MDQKELPFEGWQKTFHESTRPEKFRSLIAYQRALYLYNLLWNVSERWLKDPRGQTLSKQITGSSASICSNIEAGFGRGLGKQLIQFYLYSLGAARETKGRIYRAKEFYKTDVLNLRRNLASEVVALILIEINRQKGR